MSRFRLAACIVGMAAALIVSGCVSMTVIDQKWEYPEDNLVYHVQSYIWQNQIAEAPMGNVQHVYVPHPGNRYLSLYILVANSGNQPKTIQLDDIVVNLGGKAYLPVANFDGASGNVYRNGEESLTLTFLPNKKDQVLLVWYEVPDKVNPDSYTLFGKVGQMPEAGK